MNIVITGILFAFIASNVSGKGKYLIIPGACRTEKYQTQNRFWKQPKTLDECKKICDSNSRCGAVSYNSKTKLCLGVSDAASTTSERKWACYVKNEDDNKTCKTKSKKPCVFPFKYRGQVYLSCTTAGNWGTNWCATEVDESKNYEKWGNCDMPTCVRDPVKAEDVSFKEEAIKTAADYDNLCYTCSKILVAVNGQLEKYETYTTGYIESVLKVTKNYISPKIEYLLEAGLFKIHSGEKISNVDFKLFGAEASTHVSKFGGSAGLTVTLAGGSVSIFDLQLALGLSTGGGIIDDSLALKLFGIGGSIGRKTKICVLDTCFGVDFGKLASK